MAFLNSGTSFTRSIAMGAMGVFIGLAAPAMADSSLLLTINNPSPGVQDNFGRNLMITNDGLILAGGQINVGSVENAGVAYLFNMNTGAVVHTMPNPEPESNVGYASFSWAGDSYLVVSAPQKDDGASDESGRAYIFAKATGDLVQTIPNPTPGALEQFGYGVGMLGTKVIIGSRGDDQAGTDSGTVYLFDAASGNLLRTIPNPEPTVTDNFGYTVAGVGANKVLVGAPGATVNGQAAAGKAFLLNADTGALIHTFENPTPVENGNFGFQVRAHGDDLLIGSPLNNKAYLYDGETGNLIFQFSNPDLKPGDVFGSTVASAGDNIIIGNPQPYPEHPNPGVAYLYSANTGALLDVISNPTPEAEDRFGVSVAGHNGKLVISADQNSVGSMTRAGSIHVYQAPPAAACCEWNLYQ